MEIDETEDVSGSKQQMNIQKVDKSEAERLRRVNHTNAKVIFNQLRG